MIKLDVETSFDKLALRHRMLSADLPYATAQAINTVLFQSQRTLRNDTLPGTFQLRNKRTQSGIQIEKASKQRLTGAVGTQDWWTSEQTEDTTRIAGNQGRESLKVKGRPYLAIPVGGAPSKVIAKGMRASALIARNKAFVVQLRSGNLAVVARESGNPRGVVPLFILKPQVRIKERLHMQPSVEATIRANFDTKLRAELERIASRTN
ncbi:hypothetical protein AAGS40_23275 [Paraburkholderia sp. PREW-6R]|uniref:hypothetical protein n=1 Tax=Paraburkholderia sp. PREW-6R TaxID=3141544 RepID=UPI0031F586C3